MGYRTMRIVFGVLIAAVLSTAAVSQQLEPIRLIAILEQQRNAALTNHAQAAAAAAQLLDENIKLKGENEDLKKKLADHDKPAEPK